MNNQKKDSGDDNEISFCIPIKGRSISIIIYDDLLDEEEPDVECFKPQ